LISKNSPAGRESLLRTAQTSEVVSLAGWDFLGAYSPRAIENRAAVTVFIGILLKAKGYGLSALADPAVLKLLRKGPVADGACQHRILLPLSVPFPDRDFI
jgi:hypothetical protein